MLKHELKIMLIKQRGGREPGDELSSHSFTVAENISLPCQTPELLYTYVRFIDPYIEGWVLVVCYKDQGSILQKSWVTY